MPKENEVNTLLDLVGPGTEKGEKQIDVVLLVSDALHEVNLTLAALLPTEPGFDDLEQKRNELELRLNRLVREFFKDNTDRFISADSQLAEVNQSMKAALQNLQNLNNAIDSVTGLINAVDRFIGVVFPIPALP